MSENDDIYDHCLKHLVGIYLSTNADGPDGVKVGGMRRMILSGTIFEYNGHWILATAGHVLEQINDLIDKGHKANFKLIDLWASKNADPNLIPFHYDPDWTIAFDEEGFDFGFILLPNNTAALLKANGIIPIDERHWREPPDDNKYDDCAVLGIPESSLSASVIQGSRIKMGVDPTMVQLENKFDVPSVVSNPQTPLWYGRMAQEVASKYPFSMNGLSGGPVFGFYKISGKIHYQAIGLQNAVLKVEDYVYFIVTPFHVIGRLFDEYAKIHNGEAD